MRHEFSDYAVSDNGRLEIRMGDHYRSYAATGFEGDMAREILRLTPFKDVLEKLTLSLGCLPTQFADAYGHVFERVATLVEENRALKEERDAFRDLSNARGHFCAAVMAGNEELLRLAAAEVQAAHGVLMGLGIAPKEEQG